MTWHKHYILAAIYMYHNAAVLLYPVSLQPSLLNIYKMSPLLLIKLIIISFTTPHSTSTKVMIQTELQDQSTCSGLPNVTFMTTGLINNPPTNDSYPKFQSLTRDFDLLRIIVGCIFRIWAAYFDDALIMLSKALLSSYQCSAVISRVR